MGSIGPSPAIAHVTPPPPRRQQPCRKSRRCSSRLHPPAALPPSRLKPNRPLQSPLRGRKRQSSARRRELVHPMSWLGEDIFDKDQQRLRINAQNFAGDIHWKVGLRCKTVTAATRPSTKLRPITPKASFTSSNHQPTFHNSAAIATPTSNTSNAFVRPCALTNLPSTSPAAMAGSSKRRPKSRYLHLLS